MAGVNVGLWILCFRMFATGYKLKARDERKSVASER
jgi:hypothetical protein